MKVFFDKHYVGAEYAFDTTRKASHVAEALEAGEVTPDLGGCLDTQGATRAVCARLTAS